MANYFVNRHKGAIEWARRQGIEAEHVVQFDASTIERGDHVLGTLPFHEAAKVIDRGARYFHLEMNVPAEKRGEEHSADDMQKKYDAKLVEYRVTKVKKRGKRS